MLNAEPIMQSYYEIDYILNKTTLSKFEYKWCDPLISKAFVVHKKDEKGY